MTRRTIRTAFALALVAALTLIANHALAQGAPVYPQRPPPTPEPFGASQDASTNSDQPWTNYGDLGALSVGNNIGPSSYDARAYLAFDVSEIPTGAEIVSAMLELYLDEAMAVGPYSVRVHGVGETWEETAITWSNQPDPGTLYDTQSVDGVRGYKSWEVTDLVKTWLGKFRINHGLVLTPGTKASFGFAFYSSESLIAPPRLVVSYFAPTATATRTKTPTATPTNTRSILRPTPTNTRWIPIKPTATPTRSVIWKPPTGTPTKTATVTHTATDTPTPHLLYLPLVLKQTSP